MSDVEQKAWGGKTFDYVCAIVPESDNSDQVRSFMPQTLYAKAASTRLNRYGSGPFCRFHIPKAITREGVYVIARGDQAMYVGLCDNLSSRFNVGYGNISPKNCYVGGQSTNCKINTKILQETLNSTALQLWFLQNADKENMEREMIQHLRPPWNGRQD